VSADGPDGPPLTPAERQRLAELESQLEAEDPALADALDDPPVAPAPRRVMVAGAAAMGAALVLLATLVAGPAGSSALVLTSFLALGLWLLVRSRRSRRGRGGR
jgi:Protein of unknown function (DUF3040)